MHGLRLLLATTLATTAPSFAKSLAASKEAASLVGADQAWAAFKALPARLPSGLTEVESNVWLLENYYKRYANAALGFCDDFPADPRRWDAACEYVTAIVNSTDYARRSEIARARQLVAEILAAPQASPATQERAAFRFLAYELSPDLNPALAQTELTEIARKVSAFESRFPQALNLRAIEQRYAQILVDRDPDAARTWLRAKTASADAQIASMAAGMLELLAAKQAPVALKFTALDGRTVDTAAMRGRIVVIDFWATTCAPCLEQLPALKQLYATYHDRGVEVIGVALDGQGAREKVLRLIREQNLPWPQYFDGKGWSNAIALKYAVRQLPTTFLLNRDGLLVSTAAPSPALEAKIRELLE
jgi:thiol-disulfide isomerase/thioredoxin